MARKLNILDQKIEYPGKVAWVQILGKVFGLQSIFPIL